MRTILGISGSLRHGSFNTRLLCAAQELAPAGVTLLIGSIAEIPLYDGDLETTVGLPDVVSALKEQIVAAQGLLLVTPEYNNSLPGVLKNVIDWLSRPPSDIPRVFGQRPVALMGASTGAGATNLAQAAWLPVLRTLGAKPWFGPKLAVANAADVFDASGRLRDERLRQRLASFVAGFAEFIEASRPGTVPSFAPAGAPLR